jgi:methenyltetrahydrofolate cyclohydrolase
VELVQCCKRIAEIGNVGVLSDIAAGAGLASSVAHGAAWMVRINLKTLKDPVLVETLEERLTQALRTVEAINQQVAEIVGAKA